MTNNAPVTAGATVVFTDGCYSSYSLVAVAKALKDLDLVALRTQWKALPPPESERPSPFVAWLCAQELIEEVAYFEAWSDGRDFDVNHYG